MTAVADNKKRVTINTAKPGDRFDVRITDGGTVILTPLVPKSDNVPEVRAVRTKEGWLMFPPGRRRSQSRQARGSGAAMKAYWDSSALIEAAFRPEIRARLDEEGGITRTHSLAETFSRLTGNPDVRLDHTFRS